MEHSLFYLIENSLSKEDKELLSKLKKPINDELKRKSEERQKLKNLLDEIC